MKAILLRTTLAGALVAGAAAQAYDPMPDPRMAAEPNLPSLPLGSSDFRGADHDAFVDSLKGRHKPRGEPQFGGKASREATSVRGYGLGTRKINP